MIHQLVILKRGIRENVFHLLKLKKIIDLLKQRRTIKEVDNGKRHCKERKKMAEINIKLKL